MAFLNQHSHLTSKRFILKFAALLPMTFAIILAGSSFDAFAGTVEVANSEIAFWYHEKAYEDPSTQGLMVPRQRTRKSLNQIYQFDRTPLGKRIPVVLVPGRAEEFQHNSWWRGFYHASDKDLAFDKYFKLYVFLYDSKNELDVQAESLTTDLKRRFGHLPPSQPLMLVTYSLGGVISREALKEDEVLDQVDTMVAIAVPFHGSPMFDPEWFSEYLNPPNRSPIRRFWDRTLYRAYMFSKSNLTRGLKWDNFDRSKPQFDAEMDLKGDGQVVGDQAKSTVLPYQEYPNAEEMRSKTVVYATYLENRYTRESDETKSRGLTAAVLAKPLTLPKKALDTVLPFYGFTVHSVFPYMNLQLANLPTYTPEDPQGKNTHLYRYNDGVIPVSSMLFLPPSDKPYDSNLWGLLGMATVRNVRMFKELDHLHLGEYSILKKKLNKPDIFHPEDGQRSPHKWVIYDLLNRRRELIDHSMPAEAALR